MCWADLTLVRDEVEWNPILTRGQELTVQVLDTEGWPLPGQAVHFLVEAVGTTDTWMDLALTDDEGYAIARKVPDQPIRAELRGSKSNAHSNSGKVPYRVLGNLRARPEPYILQLQAGDLDLGSVRGSFRLSDGSPCLDGALTIRGRSSRNWVNCTLVQGAFELDELPAGELILLLGRSSGGFWPTRFRLEPGQDLDLGVLQLPPTGTLSLVSSWPAEDSEGRRFQTFLSVSIPGFGEEPDDMLSDVFECPVVRDLEYFPGEVELRVFVGELTVDWSSVSVRSGARTEVDLAPEH